MTGVWPALTIITTQVSLHRVVHNLVESLRCIMESLPREFISASSGAVCKIQGAYLTWFPPTWLLSIDAVKSCIHIKIIWFLGNLFNIPPANVLVKRLSKIEHSLHSFDIAGVPPTNILIE